MAVAIAPRSTTGSRDASALRLIDTDVHNDLPSMQELKPFLPAQWHPWLENGGPGTAARYYANTGSGRMDDAVREEDGLAAGDPDWVVQQLMTKYRIDIGVLTGSIIGAEHPARLALPDRPRQRLQRLDAREVGPPVRLLQGLDRRSPRRMPRDRRGRSIASAMIRAWCRC